MYYFNPSLYTVDTPPSPTANLKMLVAAASSALDRENAAETSQNQMDKDDEGSSRKMKSLALLCKRLAVLLHTCTCMHTCILPTPNPSSLYLIHMYMCLQIYSTDNFYLQIYVLIIILPCTCM